MGYNDRRWGNDDRSGYGRGRETSYRSGYGRDHGPDYDRGGRPQGYDHDDRGFFERAGDEVRSWFGDEEAERRRRYDERYDARYGDDDRGERSYGNYGRDRSPDYGPGYGAGSRDYGRDRGGYRSGEHYGRDRSIGTYSAGRTGDVGEGSGGDSHYRSWRDRQMDALDRDYDDYRRENQSRFENEFATYRTRRQGQRQLLEQVKEHAEVLGSDGTHVGTVDHVRGDRIKLTRNDQAAGGHHHSIPSSWLETVEEGRVTLNKTAAEAQRLWREEQDNNERNNERGALFGNQQGGQQQDRDNAGDWSGGRNLNRSFSGTY